MKEIWRCISRSHTAKSPGEIRLIYITNADYKRLGKDIGEELLHVVRMT
jgi:hypothetical protein